MEDLEGSFLPSLDLPRCLLGCPRVSAISSRCLLVVVVVPPFVVFVVVSRHSVRRPSFESAATLQGRACFPALLHTLVLGHIRFDWRWLFLYYMGGGRVLLL